MTAAAMIFAAALTVALLGMASASSKPDVCLLSLDVGGCNAGYFTRWYYDQNDARCKRFYWRGCGGNGNNFETLLQCQRTCHYTCQLPAETGRCRAAATLWHYDSTKGECATFTYGGCDGNDNRFSTRALCENACKPGVKKFSCPARNCQNTCDFGYQLDSVGCPVCSCKLNPNQAACPPQKCTTTETCYDGYKVDRSGCMTCECRNCGPICLIGCGYYNRDSNTYYTTELKQDENGCSECSCHSREDLCGAIQCDLECRAGYAKDDYGCDVCQCRNLSLG